MQKISIVAAFLIGSIIAIQATEMEVKQGAELAKIEAEISSMPPEEQENMRTVIMPNVERVATENPDMLDRFIKGEMNKDEESAFVNAMAPESISGEKSKKNKKNIRKEKRSKRDIKRHKRKSKRNQKHS